MRSLTWPNSVDAADQIQINYESQCDPGVVALSRYWSARGAKQPASTLSRLIKWDLQRRFHRGETPRVAEYLAAFPELTASRDRVVSLVYEEFCLLEERGEVLDSSTFCNDYAEWRDSLHSQLDYHRELSRAVGAEPAPVVYPQPGDRFDRYQLDSVLGNGGVARVFLATEVDLGRRQVAIKVSASFGQEPSILAKLDHRSIVPILTVAKSESGLSGICMPYRPGMTLETLMNRVGRGTPPRSARVIRDALGFQDSAPEHLGGGWLGFPDQRTYPEAVAWIGLALANALAYLHDQGISHRDIKPANILLADREGPQLLDFNLAQDPDRPENAIAAQKGGTLPYMAPEQLRAFLDPVAWDRVGPPADLYSLGLVLREMVTGRIPPMPRSRGTLPREIQAMLDRRSEPDESIREINPGVPPALETIIEKCLKPRPEDRYIQASDLAEDLHCFLDRKPLIHTPNPSKLERVVNCAYRNRHLLGVGLLFVTLGLAYGQTFPQTPPTLEQSCEQAEAWLDSPLPGDLERSELSFEELNRRYPTTARSALGLALALQRKSDLQTRARPAKPSPSDDREALKLRQRISNLLGEARQRSDARVVFENRIRKEPHPETLLLNLGTILATQRNSQGARDAWTRCLAIDPDSFAALVGVAQLDREAGRLDEAIQGLNSAIEIGERNKVDPSRLYLLRKSSLAISVMAIDQSLGDSTSEAPRELAAHHYRSLRSTFEQLQRNWDQDGSGQNLHHYLIPYYLGCIDSIRLGLEGTNLENPEVSRLRDTARDSFARARQQIVEGNLDRESLFPVIAQQEKKLQDRFLRATEGKNGSKPEVTTLGTVSSSARPAISTSPRPPGF